MMSFFDIIKRNSQDNLLQFMQDRITKDSSLDDIVATFEEMCRIPVNDDMILFETGTYSTKNGDRFFFSLVRQYPNDEEEFYQLHVNMLYEPTDENKVFQQTAWNEEISDNIFDYIRTSSEFEHCKDDSICDLEIYLDET